MGADHATCDPVYVKPPEEVHPWRRSADQGLPGDEGRGLWGDGNVFKATGVMTVQLCKCIETTALSVSAGEMNGM